MQHEVKKITLIVNELLGLLMSAGSDQIDVKIRRSEEQVKIKVIQRDTHYEEGYVELLKRKLTVPRHNEIEGYYWQLVGESDCDEELCLVGAMTDEAEVRIEDGDLHICLIRKN